MPGFYIVNEKRFPMPVHAKVPDLLPYYRWEHRVTLGYNGRRYVVFLDNLKQTVYIEDATIGLEKIEDDSLWSALFMFATENDYLMMMPPLPIVKGQQERFV